MLCNTGRVKAVMSAAGASLRMTQPMLAALREAAMEAAAMAALLKLQRCWLLNKSLCTNVSRGRVTSNI